MNRTIKPSILQDLINTSLWKNKLYDDCLNQNVFFAIRRNRVDFYHKGGLLFKYEFNEFKTHIKYAAVINKDDETNYLSQSQLSSIKLATDFETNYERIKENCSKYSGVEATGVSEIYHEHSFLSNSNTIVLDIEVAFRTEDASRKQDRVDVVLYNLKTQRIHFVEAKHFSNKELFSTSHPKVLSQLKRYQLQITTGSTNILREYRNLVDTINSIFKQTIPMPVDIDENVILLIFGFDADQKNGRLKKSILKNPVYSGTRIYAKGNISKVIPDVICNSKI